MTAILLAALCGATALVPTLFCWGANARAV